MTPDRCADCDAAIVWTKLGNVRTPYEDTGEALTLRWSAARQWHEPVYVRTYQVHQCPGQEVA